MGVKARPNWSGLPFWYRFVPHPLYREAMANPRSESGGGGGAVALHRVLQDCNLLEYEPLLLEEGLCPVLSGCVVCVRPAYVWVLVFRWYAPFTTAIAVLSWANWYCGLFRQQLALISQIILPIVCHCVPL